MRILLALMLMAGVLSFAGCGEPVCTPRYVTETAYYEPAPLPPVTPLPPLPPLPPVTTAVEVQAEALPAPAALDIATCDPCLGF